MLGIITVLMLLNSHIHRGSQWLNEESLKNSTQPNNKLSLVCDCCYKTRRRRRCKRSVLMMALQSVSQCASSASASSESLQPVCSIDDQFGRWEKGVGGGGGGGNFFVQRTSLMKLANKSGEEVRKKSENSNNIKRYSF
ncbi:hypothetical protein Tsp_07727 [Trichinella spiralis]|uniref:hypothetical protein n=1 Tax=Trichinella spiralis TaxID=6334 RepID=UPI0001EFC9F0|nr:hypothetical protein Tsp_07727 [Trichinella spiralis]